MTRSGRPISTIRDVYYHFGADLNYRRFMPGVASKADDFAGRLESIMGGGKSSWSATTRDMWVVGGTVHLVGSPEPIVDWFIRLRDAGCDGIQVNFYDFLPDLEFFGARVLPLMEEAGLRASA